MMRQLAEHRLVPGSAKSTMEHRQLPALKPGLPAGLESAALRHM